VCASVSFVFADHNTVNCEEKSRSGRTRLRLEDNIKVDHQEVGCGGIEWIEVAQDGDRWRELMNTVNI
jgi:hypothetical protein